MANIQNLRIGPAILTFKGTDIGHTEGGIKLTYERKLTDLKVDKYGDTPVDKALTGTNLTLEFSVAEPVAKLLQPFDPEGSNNSGANGQQVGFAAGEGASLRAGAGLLTLHPYNLPLTNQSEDITVYLAVPSSNIELNYEANNQRVFKVQMQALVDEEFTTGRRLGHIGPVNVS